MAWTITQTVENQAGMAWNNNLEMFKVKLDCISDASGTDTDLSVDVMKLVKNSFLWIVACVPGTGGDAPAAAFQLELQDKNDLSLFDSGAGGIIETAASFLPGTQTTGMPPPFFDKISFVCGTLGDTNTAVFYIYFAKGM